jgi:hypothetical protein
MPHTGIRTPVAATCGLPSLWGGGTPAASPTPSCGPSRTFTPYPPGHSTMSTDRPWIGVYRDAGRAPRRGGCSGDQREARSVRRPALRPTLGSSDDRRA